MIKGLLEKQPAENIVAIVRDEAKAADLAQAGVQVRVANYEDTVALRSETKQLPQLAPGARDREHRWSALGRSGFPERVTSRERLRPWMLGSRDIFRGAG